MGHGATRARGGGRRPLPGARSPRRRAGRGPSSSWTRTRATRPPPAARRPGRFARPSSPIRSRWRSLRSSRGACWCIGSLMAMVLVRFFTEVVSVLPRVATFIDIPIFLVLVVVGASRPRTVDRAGIRRRPYLAFGFVLLAVSVVSVLLNAVRIDLGPVLFFLYGFLAPIGLYYAVYHLWPPGGALLLSRVLVALALVQIVVVYAIQLPQFLSSKNPDVVSGTFGDNAYQLVFFLLVLIGLLGSDLHVREAPAGRSIRPAHGGGDDRDHLPRAVPRAARHDGADVPAGGRAPEHAEHARGGRRDPDDGGAGDHAGLRRAERARVEVRRGAGRGSRRAEPVLRDAPQGRPQRRAALRRRHAVHRHRHRPRHVFEPCVARLHRGCADRRRAPPAPRSDCSPEDGRTPPTCRTSTWCRSSRTARSSAAPARSAARTRAISRCSPRWASSASSRSSRPISPRSSPRFA